MEQRTLRLGDIVDDYCPRERRLTNHAIVAMVDDVIRQTRCTTCDAEHVYKGGQAPKRRLVKPGVPSSGSAEEATPPAAQFAARGSEPASPADPPSSEPAAPDDNGAPDGNNGSVPSPDHEREPTDLWVGHRPLIRATLPRQEGDQAPPARPIPEFTMHRYGRGNEQPFRQHHGQPRGDQQPWSNGNGHPRSGGGSGGQFRDGRGPGPGGQGRPGRRRRRRGGGKKSH